MANHQVTEISVLEYQVDSQALQQSLEDGVVPGVKILGPTSHNGRDYSEHVMQSAVSKYEGLPVNIDHPKKATDPRSYNDRFGAIKNARFVYGKGIVGDLHFNPKHSVAEQFKWDVANAPEKMGLSHNAALRMRKNGSRQIVEDIVRVRSADLVADPATTTSIFEHEENEMPIKEMTLEQIYDERPDLKQLVEGKSGNGGQLTADQLKKDHPDLVKQLTEEKSQVDEVKQLKQELEQLRSEKKQQELRDAIESEIEEAGLDPNDSRQVSEAFTKVLLATESTDERKELIKDRAALVGISPANPDEKRPPQKPRYKASTQNATEELDAESFARKLKTPA